MALSTTIFILRGPGRVPEIKRCAEGRDVAFLKELLEARPTELVTVLFPDDGNDAYAEDGPQLLQIWNGKYRHLARRHRASTKAAFAAGGGVP